MSARKKYKFPERTGDRKVDQRLQDIEDNFVSANREGDVYIDRDVHCRSIYVEGDSIYINGIKLSAPVFDDNGFYLQYDRVNKKFTYEEKASPVIEDVQDIVGAMLTGNTETFIAVTYEDSDGTIDFVVPVKDEDNMASNSAAHLPTQQSVKAYADTVQLNAELFAFFMG